MAYKGTQIVERPVARKPQVFVSTDERFCQQAECPTKLSQYNKGPFCYAHSERVYPRVRGRWGS